MTRPTPDTDDPALTEDLENLFTRNDARPLPSTAIPTTPHGRLKSASRKALKLAVRAMAGRVVIIPIISMRVKKKGGGEYSTGKRGASDDIALVTVGTRTVALALEYKAGHDTQRPTQEVFQANWEAAGGRYLLVRDAQRLAETVRHLVGAA